MNRNQKLRKARKNKQQGAKQRMNSEKRNRLIVIIVFALLAAMTVCGNTVTSATKSMIVTKSTAEGLVTDEQLATFNEFDAEYAVIYGCGLKSDATPGLYLQDRLDAGIYLYNEKVVSKLFLSGDNVKNVEINSMLKYCLSKGVPREDIVCDGYGISTYDTAYRVKYVYGIDKAILVTQTYHQYRAQFMAASLDLETLGAGADISSYKGTVFKNELREYFARLKDFVKQIGKPSAKYTEKYPEN